MSKWYESLPKYNSTERCDACGGFLFQRVFRQADFDLDACILAICKDCGARYAEKLFKDSKK